MHRKVMAVDTIDPTDHGNPIPLILRLSKEEL